MHDGRVNVCRSSSFGQICLQESTRQTSFTISFIGLLQISQLRHCFKGTVMLKTADFFHSELQSDTNSW